MLPTSQEIEQTKQMGYLEIATPMAKRGVPTVPLRAGTKIAFQMGWEELATTDLELIAKWDLEHPGSNCGSVAQAKLGGFWFFEVDSPDVIQRLKAETGREIPATFTVRSSPGKGHIYFKHTQASIAMGNIAQGFIKCNDWSARVDRQYVVSPGSLHPKTQLPYEIRSTAEIVEAPEWLITWLLSQKLDKKTIVTNVTAGPIIEGGRNNSLASLGGKLRHSGFDYEFILSALQDANEKRCRPPLSDTEVQTIAASVSRYEPAKEINFTIGGKPPELSGPATATTAVPAPANKRLNVQTASGVITKKIQWLWKDRVPLGKLTLFVGVPGSGKSLCAGDVAARLSTGAHWYGAENSFKPSDTLMLVGEDDVDDTTTPRLQAAGADLTKIHFLRSVITDEGKGETPQEREIQFDRDLTQIEEHLKANPNIRLIVVDPISNYMGSAKMNAEQEVRAVLIPLKNLAERAGVSIIAVMHLNKKSDTSAINRVGGAMAFVGVARAAYLFQECDAELEEGAVNRLQQHFMVLLKCNITKKVDGLVYEIPAKPVRVEGSDESMPIIRFIGTTTTNAEGLLQQKSDSKGRPADGLASAKSWLRDFLKNGPKLSSEVIENAKELKNISSRTVERAKAELGVVSSKSGRQWLWSLPEQPTADVDLERGVEQ